MWRQLLLSIAGYEVLTATDADSAIQLFGSHPVDLVVIGCDLPDQSWFQLAGEMKRLDPTIPMVILNTGPEQLPKRIEGDVVFRSGVTPTYLLATIEKLTKKPQPEASSENSHESGAQVFPIHAYSIC